MAAVSGLLGPLGALVGEELAKTDAKTMRARRLYDPADAITAVLMKGMAKRFTLQVVDTGGVLTKGLSAGELSREFPGSDLVLDVRTTDWGFVPVRIGHYGVLYEGSLSLIDTRSKAVIAEGQCTGRPVDAGESPSYDELMANDAAVLKDKFRGIEEYCADDYRTRILGLFGQ
jgi:hypothetical protein